MGDLMTNCMCSQQAIKAIIFDCDGTLVDSEDAHRSSWRQTAENYGFEISPEEFLGHVGKPDIVIARMLAEMRGAPSADILFNQKRDYFLEHLHKGFPPIHGTVQFVHQLIKQKDILGLKIAVASAAPKYEILTNLKMLGLDKAFDIVLSGHEDLTDYNDPEGVNKPKPYVYLHTAALLGVSPFECIVIEDSHTGVAAGANAGCITVAVPNLHSQHHDLSRATFKLETLADMTVERLLELSMRKNHDKQTEKPL